MSNRIRHYLKAEVEELLPLLHETYRLVGQYQKNRVPRNEERLVEQLDLIGEHLQMFKVHVQPKKQSYFDAILYRDLPTSDRIIALDIAIGMMHIEFSKPRAYTHQESDTLRRILEQSRISAHDTIIKSHAEDTVLLQGIAASPGIASGKVALAKRPADFRRLPTGCILVTKMTRPEMLMEVYDKVAGIITDAGGSLCHAAVVSRELRIPCVVGTHYATSTLKNKWLVSVDGTQGVVKKLSY
jgi:phosphoenolpyruvate synthase/pyruvate phosphate dikinase